MAEITIETLFEQLAKIEKLIQELNEDRLTNNNN